MTRRLASAAAPATALLALLLAACRTEQTLITPDPHLERMLRQEKRLPYRPDPDLPGGLVMQPPPEGAVPVDEVDVDPTITEGKAEGDWVLRIPVPVDRTTLEAGRSNFDIFCATCHGILGDGRSAVARKMALRKPPSLHDPRIVAYPAGRIFSTIRHGYGLMPSYAVQLGTEDAWAVVAYVEALQLARAARVDRLPPDVRARLAKEAP